MIALYVFSAILGNGLWFSEANGANFGVSEDDGGDILVGEEGLREMGWAEEAVGKVTACCYCHYLEKVMSAR